MLLCLEGLSARGWIRKLAKLVCHFPLNRAIQRRFRAIIAIILTASHPGSGILKMQFRGGDKYRDARIFVAFSCLFVPLLSVCRLNFASIFGLDSNRSHEVRNCLCGVSVRSCCYSSSIRKACSSCAGVISCRGSIGNKWSRHFPATAQSQQSCPGHLQYELLVEFSILERSRFACKLAGGFGRTMLMSQVVLFTPGEQAAAPFTGYLTNRTVTGLFAQSIGGAVIVIER